jgi:type IV pilus assembly protein PilW
MKTPNRLRATELGQRGFSLIEIMVGVVIGMIAVLVIYQVFTAAEGIKRNTTSAGDAQQNGLLASFMLGTELGNASNGVAASWQKLGSCPFTGSAATSLRPIPILISDGGANADKFVVNYSIANQAIPAVPFKAASTGPLGTYIVHAPFGFHPPAGAVPGDIIIAISGGAPGGGTCTISSVTGVAPHAGTCGTDDCAGQVEISHTAAPGNFTDDSYLLNMGPATNAQRVLFDIDPATNVLRSTSLWDANGAPAGAPVPNPMASNVVTMKLLYGIDSDGDGLLDTWVTPTGAWSDVNVLAADTTTLRKIKAVRLGVIVQGEQWDRDAPDNTITLFDDTTVPFSQSFPRAGGGNYRYRFYETIVPMRNSIWN